MATPTPTPTPTPTTRPIDEAADDMGWRPHLLVDAVCEMMQVLWGDGESRRDEILDQYEWSDHPSVTSVQIAPEGKLDISGSGLDLRLVVETGGSKFQDTSMQHSFRKDNGSEKLHSFLVSTTIVIKCVSKNRVFSHMVAAECAIRLQDNARRIKNQYAFNDMLVGGYGPPQSLQEKQDGPYVTPVKLSIVAEHSSDHPVG